MLVPTVYTAPGDRSGLDRDYRDLLTSLRLLAGKDCRRDPDQAHVMLVGLSESQTREIADDAQAVLRAAMAREWFTTTAPKYYELERIAEKSVTRYRRQPDRTKMMMAVMVMTMVVFAVWMAKIRR